VHKKLLVLTATAAALSLTATAASANFLDDLFGNKQKEVVQLKESTEKIALDQTLWSINDKTVSSWSVTKKGKSYVLKQTKGEDNFLSPNFEGGKIVHESGKYSVSTPASIVFVDKGQAMNLLFGKGKNPVTIQVQLQAYDVSGQKIADFLTDRTGEPYKLAEKVGNAKFPAGAKAYRTISKFLNNQLVLPAKESFTNAKTTQDLIKNFSKVPFCLAYEQRPGSQAFGIMFDAASAGKNTGSFKIMHVRRDTIFCRPTEEAPIVGGTWKFLKTTGKHGAVVLTMPDKVDPRDYGIKLTDKGIAQFAFIAPAKGDHVFRPGKFYKEGLKMESRYYLFNDAAMKAIQGAM